MKEHFQPSGLQILQRQMGCVEDRVLLVPHASTRERSLSPPQLPQHGTVLDEGACVVCYSEDIKQPGLTRNGEAYFPHYSLNLYILV